jgi:hypothetical protein
MWLIRKQKWNSINMEYSATKFKFQDKIFENELKKLN